ncbi:radical SAM protein [Bacteroidales bacterium OttesenSCG-928-K03]|nr:radical SAM protein [Odoribacter sp. OttesenSCG-928-L07]MDL2239957.1 radical SAM protein [Bacteroidales bacterium OttesenSCG-928-L14]MDL2240416.1 radical SAM protein [Bacteroidales bacterium OttesenSCG-928-K22]MDL2242982.1 radical SAM protein [Bacteroidales bacterium OttesenSCG-928-K03]
MQTVPAKKIVSAYTERGWFGANFNMNIYRGCCHGCIYCDSRSECYNIPDFDTVKAKENALSIIENELKSKRKKGIIMTGAMSDPYNPFEKTEQLTRGALHLINKYNFGINILTKSNLVARDADILKSIQEHNPAVVNFTITTANDELCKKIEPNVAKTSERLKALESLAKADISCGIGLMPVLPFINDNSENISQLVKLVADAGAKWIFSYPTLAVSLRQNQRKYYYDRLDENFPGIKDKYIKTYGSSYWCASQNSDELWKELISLCKKYNLLYRHNEIEDAIRNDNKQRQISLF